MRRSHAGWSGAKTSSKSRSHRSGASRKTAVCAASQVQQRAAESILGVPKNASASSIRAAFRQRSIELHPDRGGDSRRFAELVRARDVLLDSATTQHRSDLSQQKRQQSQRKQQEREHGGALILRSQRSWKASLADFWMRWCTAWELIIKAGVPLLVAAAVGGALVQSIASLVSR